MALLSGQSLPLEKVKQLSCSFITVHAEHSNVLRGLRAVEECTKVKEMKNA
jgi:hypothetical protein